MGAGYRIKYFNPSLVLERMFSSSASALFQWSLSRTYVKRWKGSGILHLPLQLDPVLIHLIDMAKTASIPCFILLDAFWERIYSGCQSWSITGPPCRFSWWGLKPICEEARWVTNSKQNRNQSYEFQKMAIFLIFFRILLQVFSWFLFKELRAGGRNQLGPELGKGLAK